MKKGFFIIFALMSLFFLCVNIAQAVDVSATMPSGSLGFHVSKIIANAPFDGSGINDTWPPAGSSTETSLSFGTLVELVNPTTGAKLGVFGPSDRRYYAIEISVSGGGFPSTLSSVTVSFSDATVGHKFLATYFQMTFDSANPLKPKQVLILGPTTLASSQTFAPANFNGHWVRMIVGVAVPPDPTINPTPFPADAVAFTSADLAGTYSGILTIGGLALPI